MCIIFNLSFRIKSVQTSQKFHLHQRDNGSAQSLFFLHFVLVLFQKTITREEIRSFKNNNNNNNNTKMRKLFHMTHSLF